MFQKLFFLASMVLCGSLTSYAQRVRVMPLYEQEIPNLLNRPDHEKATARGAADTILTNVSIPTLTAYIPAKEKATGMAVIICPGGGYHMLVAVREGSRIARAFNEQGIAAFVLKYRLPSDSTMKNKAIGPAMDAQRAIQVVRQHAEHWNIDPHKVGIMGFSAGGHLASTVSTHYNYAFLPHDKKTNLRPDFSILIYPVISFQDDISHKGSKTNLLGTNPSKKQVDFYSNELQVTKNTPPTFITQAEDDKTVPFENSVRYYKALQAHDVPAVFKIYHTGGHGFRKAPPFSDWFGECIKWLNSLSL